MTTRPITVCLFAILFVLLAEQSTVVAQKNQVGASRDAGSGRLVIVENEYGKTLRTPEGLPLRGASLGVFQYARDTGAMAFMKRRAYWRQLHASGINSVRVVFFDAWQRSHGAAGSNTPWPYADLENPSDVLALTQDLDFIVDAAQRRGIQVIINYHDTGGYRDPDYSQPAGNDGHFPYLESMAYCKKFWSIVAPRYADQVNVAYELTNEPVMWTSDDYTDEVLTDQAKLFGMVREFAPNSHIITLTFANHEPDDETLSMVTVARRLQDKGVDFSNASVGFHPYNRQYPNTNPQQPILDLMDEFPVINTEQNYPAGVISSSSDPDASGLEGDYFGVQSMERLGIGWFHWNCETIKEFEEYFMSTIIPDARDKAYYWGNN